LLEAIRRFLKYTTPGDIRTITIREQKLKFGFKNTKLRYV